MTDIERWKELLTLCGVKYDIFVGPQENRINLVKDGKSYNKEIFKIESIGINWVSIEFDGDGKFEYIWVEE